MNLFDVIGPVMIGPSSSHTAGAVRLGNMAKAILGEKVKEARICLHGSFSTTYKGHGTDLALAAGLQGWSTDDPRIPNAFEHAEANGLALAYQPTDLGQKFHPNTIRFYLTGERGAKTQVTGYSVGGGRVCISEVDDYPLEFTGEFTTLLVLHLDKPGAITLVTGILSSQGVNIAQMRDSRKRKGETALMVLETDQPVSEQMVEAIAKLPQVISARLVDRP